MGPARRQGVADLIICGRRLYGHTDEVEGLGYVSTSFVHIWFLPLVPFSSIFVVGEDDDGMRGIDLPLSFKSIFSVWTRTAALLGGIASFVVGVAAGVDSMSAVNPMLRAIQRGKVDPEQGVGLATELAAGGAGVCMSIVCAAVFLLVGMVSRRAGAARRAELMEKLGISMEPIPPTDAGPDPADEGVPAELV